MVNSCSVLGCSNRSTREKGKSFFRIPKIIKNQGEQAEKLSTERRQRWLDSINRNDWNPEVGHWRVCSDHFINGKPSKLFDRNNPDWAPSVKMGHQRLTRQMLAKRRQQRLRKQKENKRIKDAAGALVLLKTACQKSSYLVPR